MNAFNMAQSAYASSTTPIRTPRSIEYQAFARVTRKLRAATGKHGSEFHLLADAIHENRQLWTLLAADIASNDNALPEQLRGQLFYLAEFTVAHSRKVLKLEESVEALIDVNTAMMRGLKSEGDIA